MARRNNPEQLAAAAVDLFSYHPGDYTLLGGSWSLKEDRNIRCNVVIAGANAVAVDSVGAAVMGFDPRMIPALRLAEEKGLGTRDLGIIWVRGNEIGQAQRALQQSHAHRPSPRP